MPRNSEGSQNDRAPADGKSVVRALAAFVTILLVLWPYAFRSGTREPVLPSSTEPAITCMS